MRRPRLLLAAAIALAAPAAASAQTLPGAGFYVKNNTKKTVACTLAVDAQAPLALKLKAGREFSARYRDARRISLACPKVRAAPYEPLTLGTHYAFLKVNGRVDLIEVSPDR
jgi:hypothetical protein